MRLLPWSKVAELNNPPVRSPASSPTNELTAPVLPPIKKNLEFHGVSLQLSFRLRHDCGQEVKPQRKGLDGDT